MDTAELCRARATEERQFAVNTASSREHAAFMEAARAWDRAAERPTDGARLARALCTAQPTLDLLD